MNEATLPPEEARMWLRLGLRAVRAGDHVEARRYFQWAREAGPDNVIALLWLAGLTEDRDQAVALLNRVLELDPRNERARAGIRALCRPDEVNAAAGAVAVEPAPQAETVDVPTYRKMGQQDAALVAARPERWSGWLLAMLLAAIVLVTIGWLAFGQLRSVVAPLLAPAATSVPTQSTDPRAILPAVTETPAPTTDPVADGGAAQTAAPTPAASATRSASPALDSTGTPTPAATPSTSPR